MPLLFAILLYAVVISAVIRGNFTYSGHTYNFKEHPIQFIIVITVFLGTGTFCFYKFLKDIGAII